MSLKTGLHRVALAMKATGVILGIGGLVFAATSWTDRGAAVYGGIATVVLWTAAWILEGFIAKDKA